MNIDVTTLTVSIPSSLLADVRRIAQQERRPQDNTVAHLLRLGIEKHLEQRIDAALGVKP